MEGECTIKENWLEASRDKLKIESLPNNEQDGNATRGVLIT